MSNDDGTTCWPTFEECPREKCNGMTATDGTSTWCLQCDWTDRPDLFTDDTDDER